MRASRSRRATGSADSSSTPTGAGVATVVRLAASDSASPPDSTAPDYDPPATTTHAQYPIGWIHRHRQRLPAVDASSSAQAMMSSLSIRSGNARLMWGSAGTLPQRCRHDAIPPDPARQETPDTFGTKRADWPCIATRWTPDDAPRKPRRVSPAPATSRVSLLRIQPRRGLPARRACCHTRCGTAC